MSLKRLLIANRGEIAIRIARAAAGLGIETVAIFSHDDRESDHVTKADRAVPVPGRGPAAYLDIAAVVAAAQAAGCDAVHPGYGFLSENARFAEACEAAGIVFVGPTAAQLAALGDKSAARDLAETLGIPLARGRAVDHPDEAAAFLDSLGTGGAMLIKAVAGGGGRGIRPVGTGDAIADTFARCRSEALGAFGDGALYVEELIAPARHIEVQILGDSAGDVIYLGDRECSLQRRYQKLIEIAPSPNLAEATRAALADAALRLAGAVGYRGAGTVEFLVSPSGRFVFLEVNPRLQVEHTITEAVTGIDLVQAQLRIAGGATRADLGLADFAVRPNGHALQVRIIMERVAADGTALATSGTIAALDLPGGPGVRVDSYGYTGYQTNPLFDPLLAKLIVHSASPNFADTVAAARRALADFRIAGVETNVGFQRALLARPEVAEAAFDTRFVEANLAEIVAAAAETALGLPPFDPPATQEQPPAAAEAPADGDALVSPMPGVVVAIDVAEGDIVRAGQPLLLLEAMKMEHVVAAPVGGTISRLCVTPMALAVAGAPLLFIVPESDIDRWDEGVSAQDLDTPRPDLARVLERRAATADAARPEAMARRHAANRRSIRENIADLCDAGSFIEYGALGIAAQRRRRDAEDLIRAVPADGIVTGIGQIGGRRCAVLGYDYTVLAGTQGHTGHLKTDRLMEIAWRERLPVVLFAEGGGGRPGDVDRLMAAGLDMPTFARLARMNGRAPMIAIVTGRCFAGNAAMAGCAHAIIATSDTSIGMGGPAMIEGGGLGLVAADAVGPISVQEPNGVIDLVVSDDGAAVAAAKRLLGYFGPSGVDPGGTDQRSLRHAVPKNRRRAYDMRAVVDTLADVDSVMEVRRMFGRAVMTMFARLGGQAVGILASDPSQGGGAIDADAADKAARFAQLCDHFGLPIVALSDTPGFLVGPQAEQAALVRHAGRLFVTMAAARIPILSVIVRRGYGLGAMALAGGSYHAPVINLAWPTAELGSMGIEGAVRLAYRREMEAIADEAERRAYFDAKVAEAYEQGSALSAASYLEVDDVIDPADTRAILVRMLAGIERPVPRDQGFVDCW